MNKETNPASLIRKHRGNAMRKAIVTLALLVAFTQACSLQTPPVTVTPTPAAYPVIGSVVLEGGIC
jgi:hypothetical protein